MTIRGLEPILIDTNIYTHALAGDPETTEILRHTQKIAICCISIGELLSGFKGVTREKENRKELEEFLDSPRVKIYGIDDDTAEFYAEILNNLRKNGRPIPTNDIWIASVALQYGLKLLSKDHHFKYVPGLVFT
jgi:predicted nucleic acid-binding protein